MDLIWCRGAPELVERDGEPYVQIPAHAEEEYELVVRPGPDDRGEQPPYIWFADSVSRGAGTLLAAIRRFGLLSAPRWTGDSDSPLVVRLEREETEATLIHLMLLLWYAFQEKDASILKRIVQVLEAPHGYPNRRGLRTRGEALESDLVPCQSFLDAAEEPGDTRWHAAARLLDGILKTAWEGKTLRAEAWWSREEGLQVDTGPETDRLNEALVRAMGEGIGLGIRLRRCDNGDYCRGHEFFHPTRKNQKYCSKPCRGAAGQRRFDAKQRN